MGLMLSIVSRFRKRATTREVLEGIDEDVKRLESTLARNQKLQKKIVLSLLTFSFLLYCVAVAVFYFLLLPDNWSERAIWVLPFAIFPALIYLLKRCFHFIFVTRIKRIGYELDKLNERKKKILDDVTENETYKVAKELLEKYDPKGEIIKRDFAVTPLPVARIMSSPGSQHGELRHRTNAATAKDLNGKQLSSNSLPSTPVHDRTNQSPQVKTPINTPGVRSPLGTFSPSPMMNSNGLPSPVAGMAFQGSSLRKYPILPRERSTFDKVAEYFVGDGPSYRYALICKFCHGHNGMALKDEFEFIAFRCCYCGAPNPARKSRMNAPPLEDPRSSDQESDKEKAHKEEAETRDDDNSNQEEEQTCQDKADGSLEEKVEESRDSNDEDNNDKPSD